jgi:hypothetical protein
VSIPILAALITAGATISATLLTLAIQAGRQRKKRHQARKVTVERISDASDPDVAIALSLFERRIPDEERDSPEDIVRWLREVQNETREGICKLADFFLIGRVRDEVAGFAYLQFYPAFSLAYFSYLVVDDKIPEAKECHVSTAMLERATDLILRSKSRCYGIVLEVDEPELLQGEPKRRAEARIRRFQLLSRQLRFPLKTLAIDYFQPRLSLAQETKEQQMRLMYAVPNPSIEPSRITKKEAARILSFLGDAIYGDHFEHQVELDQMYRNYLISWRENIISGIPDVVDLK